MRQPLGAARVLVVDDYDDTALLLANVLESYEFSTAVATTGAHALEAARAQTFDIVVLDLDLPAMGGVEVIRALKADPATADIAIVVLTGLEEKQRAAALQAGANAAFVKPAPMRELVATLRSVAMK